MAEILTVEDEPLVRFLIVETLTDMGHTVREAGNGEEALAILRNAEKIDVIVTDVRMPKLDGFALARAAREIRPEIPFVFMTGYSGTAMPEEFTGDRILGKPFAPETLIATINKILGTA